MENEGTKHFGAENFCQCAYDDALEYLRRENAMSISLCESMKPTVSIYLLLLVG